MRYLPHTDEDIKRMLGTIGKPSVAALFAHIPDRLRTKRALDIAPLDEGTLLAHLGELGSKSRPAVGATSREGAALSFLGAGITPHTIPSAVDALLMRSEWYTSYTPYQPEISQGTLQAIFEYQTIVAELLGLDVSNASMYDGASAAAEGVMMARRLTGRRRALVVETVHPQYADTIATYLRGEDHRNDDETILPAGADGRIDLKALDAALKDDVACVVVQTPNFYGVVEDLAPVVERAKKAGVLVVAANTEPLAFGVVTPPGEQGADIAVSEGIGLASGPNLGGPGLGLFASRADHVRQLPGRLIGETVDKDGRRGYVLTLATREQHIRREKATSNICTNQGLIALAFTIHMCAIGKKGLVDLARLNLSKAEYAKSKITSLPGFSATFSGPTFNEFCVNVRGGDAKKAVAALAERGIYAGVPACAQGMFKPSEKNRARLVVAVTERHTKADIDKLAESLDEVCK